ncbi:MAG TPA: hypothetical protein VFU65_18335, partial [Actinocrinis sp.]|nr:hypothetical protein [Actinocrinis sp.]
ARRPHFAARALCCSINLRAAKGRGSVSQQGKSWPVRNFALANPIGPGQADVPAFLRRLADSVQAHGPIEIQDIVFRMEMDDEGVDLPTATVYFHEAHFAERP